MTNPTINPLLLVAPLPGAPFGIAALEPHSI